MRRAGSALLLAIAAGSAAQASEPARRSPDAPEARCRIGLVLSGGGARGGAHVGVLKVLEELHVPVDCIAGTSMGSIVGAFYSIGLSPADMERFILETDWGEAIWDTPHRDRESFRRRQDDFLSLLPLELGVGLDGVSSKSGISGGTRLDLLFRGLTLEIGGLASFDHLRIPYRAIAADLKTGEMVVLDHGDLARAMRASMSIPGAFTPVELEGRVLVDGGIARNLPVDVARAMGAERIIAIDAGTHPLDDVEHLSPLGVIYQAVAVMGEPTVKGSIAQLGKDDLLIVPVLQDLAPTDFTRVTEAISMGEDAARAQAAELQRFSVPEEEYAEFLHRQRRETGEIGRPLRVDSIEIEGVQRVPEEVVRRRMKTRSGEALRVPVLYDDLERIAQLGDFESIGYRVEPGEAGSRLVIEAQEKSWGPGYLRFGIAAETNFESEATFGASIYLRWPEINRLGAEWKTVGALGNPAYFVSELYQPLENSRTWFVAPRIAWSQERMETLLPNGDLEGLKTRETSAGLDLGFLLRSHAEIRLGAVRGNVHQDPTTTATIAPLDAGTGGARLRFTFDRLDSVYFPRHGNFTTFEVMLSRDALGGDDEFDKVSLKTTQAFSFGRDTLVGSARLGTDLGSQIPFYAQFELGGFLNLSGFPRDSLRGDVAALFSLADYFKLTNLGTLGELYAGAAVQAGNVWATTDEIGGDDLILSGTLFLGVSTRFIPVYVGYGLAEGGHGSSYLFIGIPF